MPALFYKTRIFIVILLSIVLLASSCKKQKETYTTNILEQYFEENILNRDYKIILATNNSTDITPAYDGWIFRLLKNTYYTGPMTATKGSVTYTGTWTCNEDYGKLTIILNQPSIPTEFVYLNRDWRFVQKAVPIMIFAPWGSSAPTELQMERL